ncbi:MAG: glycosyltransferase [Chitinophagaceae bacterium]|nr:glycosyltransferase [Chitinophagaceae bacterium]
MSLIILIVLVIFLSYAVLLLFYRDGWIRTPETLIDKQFEPQSIISIIIPARNEEKHIGHLLKDLLSQYYPSSKMEIIVVDDHSTDQTASIVQSFQGVKYIPLADHTQGEILNSYKKKAITIGIQASSGQLIVTTDADCRMGPFWLHSIAEYIEKNHCYFLAGPVAFQNRGHWFDTFQSLDFTTMQGITAAVIYTRSATMCNGANLAYTRSLFDAVGGFSGIDAIASGDDMLLMHKAEQKFPKSIRYLKCKEAIVTTEPVSTVKDFFAQRIRWASKSSKFEDRRLKWILGLVFIFNLVFPILLIGSIFWPACLFVFFSLLIAKTIVELLLLYPVSQFFNKRNELPIFFILQLLHIPYIICSALMGQMGSYQWKGRQVK